jgi:hypothetical protein
MLTKEGVSRAERVAALRGRLSKELLEKLEGSPEAIRIELESRERSFPSKDFVPNVAQERALGCCRDIHSKTGRWTQENWFIAGNGAGKTAVEVAALLVGVTMGKRFLSERWFGGHGFFDEMERIREKRPLRVRIVCDSAGVEESGPIVQNVRQWIPLGRFGGRVGGGKNYFTELFIPSPDPERYHPTRVDIKTHGQPTTAHAGSEVDVLIFDEPAPRNVYDEESSRTRRGGYIFGFMTPLNAAPYLIRVIDSPGSEGKLTVARGSIWDNCADIPGNRGVLSRSNIEEQIRRWQSLDPIIAEARIHGRFMQLAGAVYKLFERHVHVVPAQKIPSSWNVWMCVDPHPVKPSFAVWMALTPTGDWYVIAEWPTDPWDQLSTTHLTIKDFGLEWTKIERGGYHKFPYLHGGIRIMGRKGDPNAFKESNPITRRTYQEQYEWDTGMEFDLDVPDSIDLRHNAIKDLIKYDFARPLDSLNRPHLYVFDSCENVIRGFGNYSWKLAGKDQQGLTSVLEEEWMCPMSAVGYLAVSVKSWIQTGGSLSIGTFSDEYAEIQRGKYGDRFDPNVLSDRQLEYSGERLI